MSGLGTVAVHRLRKGDRVRCIRGTDPRPKITGVVVIPGTPILYEGTLYEVRQVDAFGDVVLVEFPGHSFYADRFRVAVAR